jgi:hypothetical protein
LKKVEKGYFNPVQPGDSGLKKVETPLGVNPFQPPEVNPAPDWLALTVKQQRAGLKPLDPRRFRKRWSK